MLNLSSYDKYCPSCGNKLTWELANGKPWIPYDSKTGEKNVRVILYCKNYENISGWKRFFGLHPEHHTNLSYTGMHPVIEDMPVSQFKKLQRKQQKRNRRLK